MPSDSLDAGATTQKFSTTPPASLPQTENSPTPRPSKRTRTSDRPPCCTEPGNEENNAQGGTSLQRTVDRNAPSATNSVSSVQTTTSSAANTACSSHRSSVTSESSLKRSHSCCSIDNTQPRYCETVVNHQEYTPQPDANIAGSAAGLPADDGSPHGQATFSNSPENTLAIPHQLAASPGTEFSQDQGVGVEPTLAPHTPSNVTQAHQTDNLLTTGHQYPTTYPSQLALPPPDAVTAHPNSHDTTFDTPIFPTMPSTMASHNYPLSTYNPWQAEDYSALCSCGDACRCVACPLHPYNAVMKQYVQGMGAFSLLDNDAEGESSSAMPTPTVPSLPYTGSALSQPDTNPYYPQHTYAAPDTKVDNSVSTPHDQLVPPLSVYSAKYNDLIMERGAYYEMPYPVDIPEDLEISNNAPLLDENGLPQTPSYNNGGIINNN